ncbi:MAG TPA: hypothetical protein VNR42_08480 [Solirubrobacteraceae bacterium]|nr:hypothetical protein [Solirubrobacteraceae bacterium]
MRRGPILLAGLCALAFALGGCGDTLQDQTVSANALEGVIAAPYPVYWLGSSFNGMSLTESTRDPGGAYTLQYGNCVRGGQSVCVPPLRIVSSPDNSFIPGGSTPSRVSAIRGVAATIAEGGRSISIPTAGVVVSIYASSPQLALAAARTVVAINEVSAPETPLPAPLPDTGFGSTPLPSSQIPAPLHPLG